MLMHHLPSAALLLAAVLTHAVAEAQPLAAPSPLQPLPRSTPEAEGVDSAGLLALVEAFDTKITSVHSLMLVRHGKVLAEGWWAPYAAGDLHIMYSVSKSFTSTAVGLAAQEGLLSVNDLVLSFFPELAPEKPAE
jgi:CubicO group peptidase (beta-lactamase class C family)